MSALVNRQSIHLLRKASEVERLRDRAVRASHLHAVTRLAFVRPVVLPGQAIPSSNGTAIADALGTDIGNVGRNVLRGPRQSNVDFSVIKRLPISESKNIEMRVEFFNLFNHVNFANPISNFNALPSNSIDRDTGRIIIPPISATSGVLTLQATTRV